MKLILGLVLFAFLALGCRLWVPDDLVMIIEPFDGYYVTTCGRYDARENVIHINERCPRRLVVLHELCHAHQDTGEAVWDWPDTAVGKSYERAVGRRPLIAPNLVEDFATACARFYFNQEGVARSYPVRYEWMTENLPLLPPEVPPSP